MNYYTRYKRKRNLEIKAVKENYHRNVFENCKGDSDKW